MCAAFTAAFLKFEIQQLDVEFDTLFAGLPAEYRAEEITGSFGCQYEVDDSACYEPPTAAEDDWSCCDVPVFNAGATALSAPKK